MTDFHTGVHQNMSTEQKGLLTIYRSPEDAKKMIAFITHGDATVCAFGRVGLTNFAQTHVLLDEGVPIYCSEQLFALYKTLFVDTSKEGASYENVLDCMSKIFFAATPVDAKKAGGQSLKGLDINAWNANSEQFMFYAIVQACKNETAFNRYKHHALLLGSGKCKVFETNTEDKVWGVGSNTQNFVNTLVNKANDASFNLMKEADNVAVGTNKLGEILTDFLVGIRDMSHTDYLDLVRDIKFVEIVTDEDFRAGLDRGSKCASDEEARSAKRTRTE